MPFEKGVSGNPGGRPKGTGDRRTELRSLLDPHAPDLVEKVVEKALSGDMAAMRLCLDRCIPTYKAIDSHSKDLMASLDAKEIDADVIVEMVGNGSVDLGSGLAWMQLLRHQSEFTEIKNITERLDVLEGAEMR